MKILVTGGNGFIGSNLIRKLINQGCEVTSLDNLSTGLLKYEVEGCKYLYGDVQRDTFWQKDSYQLCYHLAGLSRIQPSLENPNETFRVNTAGVQVVAEWARLNKVKVVYSGSSSKWHSPESSPYATFKKLGEDILKMYKACYGCDFEIARFYNVYGPNELLDGKWAALIGIWRHQIQKGLPLAIVGDGKQRRDFTHVDDIVDALYRIGVGNQKHKDAWELGTGRNHSINEVYEMFVRRFGKLEKVYLPDQQGNYRETLRQNVDALLRLDWNPSDKLEEYILNL
jgi:UDP-glucose 4-epimerase